MMKNRWSAGEIDRVSEYSFIWKINDFFKLTEKEVLDVCSHEFQFVRDWFLLKLYKTEKESSILTCFCLLGFSNRPTVTYRLCITDGGGEHYWKSDILTERFGGGSGTVQELCLTDLQKEASRIAPRGVLSLHINFYPPTTKQELPTPGTDEDKLLQKFKDLLLNGEDCDVTLNVKGKKFECHQLILKCRSEIFRTMFEQEPVDKITRVVDIDDCEPSVFPDFLLFLYTGKLEHLDVNTVALLHYLGHKYAVEGLVAACVQFMINNFAVELFCEFVGIGVRHCEKALLESAKKFFERNVIQIVATEKWKEFERDYPTAAHELFETAENMLLPGKVIVFPGKKCIECQNL